MSSQAVGQNNGGDSWNPIDNLSIGQRVKFELNRWAEVDSHPEWVGNHEPTYTKGKVLTVDSDRAYHEKEYWVGDSLEYLLKWEANAQNDIDISGMYVKQR